VRSATTWEYIHTATDNLNNVMPRSGNPVPTMDRLLRAFSYFYPHEWIKLEYSNAVWHPRFKKDIEKVYGRATELVTSLHDMPYQKRLYLPSLVYRRYRGDMIEVYKFIHGIFTTRGYAKRGICRRRVSVCVCVCVSHSGIVSKRLNVGSRK